MKKILMFVPVVALLFMGCSRSEEDKAAKAQARAPEGMALVDAGKFYMGTSRDIGEDGFYKFGLVKPFYADAAPMHELSLDAYYIDKYEVSNEGYKEFMDSTDAPQPAKWKAGAYREGMGMRPVGGVSWFEAAEYCKWKSKRLPTEAEWEKAARGTDKREFPWGDDDYDETRANVAIGAELYRDTVDVDSLPGGASPYGVYNMAGNVWEWTDSWYNAYSGAVYESDRFGERERVVRGNSVNPIAHFPPEEHRKLTSWYSKVYFRFPVLPGYRIADVGFRCAKSAP